VRAPGAVAAVEVVPVALPLRSAYRIATAVQTRAEYVLVRVRTEDGLEGIGEAAPFVGESEETPADITGPPRRAGQSSRLLGWVPYWFERMDEHYAKLAHLVPALKRPPSDWARDPRVIFSCDPDEETLPLALELLGDTQGMYASDYPHWDAMTPWTVKILAERGNLAEPAKRKILGENAARFFSLRQDGAAAPRP
jgi:hypothetical protein